MPQIIEYDTSRVESDDAILVRVDDGRVFVCVSERIRLFALQSDADAFQVLQRAFDSNPALFKQVRGRVLAAVPEVSIQATFTSHLTDRDRERLRAMTLKHWRFYFASHPTRAQVDQLIDAIGPQVAAKMVKAAVDTGAIH